MGTKNKQNTQCFYWVSISRVEECIPGVPPQNAPPVRVYTRNQNSTYSTHRPMLQKTREETLVSSGLCLSECPWCPVLSHSLLPQIEVVNTFKSGTSFQGAGALRRQSSTTSQTQDVTNVSSPSHVSLSNALSSPTSTTAAAAPTATGRESLCLSVCLFFPLSVSSRFSSGVSSVHCPAKANSSNCVKNYFKKLLQSLSPVALKALLEQKYVIYYLYIVLYTSNLLLHQQYFWLNR